MAENVKNRTAAGESPLPDAGGAGKEPPAERSPGLEAGAGGKAAGHGTAAGGGSRKAGAQARRAQEAAYSAGELASCAESLFQTRRECAEAALKAAGKQEYTLKEAAEIVKQFLKKEVRR